MKFFWIAEASLSVVHVPKIGFRSWPPPIVLIGSVSGLLDNIGTLSCISPKQTSHGSVPVSKEVPDGHEHVNDGHIGRCLQGKLLI